jgi:hypothetical protein
MSRWAVLAVVLAVGACSSGSPATPTPAPPATGVDASRIWGEFVACARTNGFPVWPDAVINPQTGQADFPPVPNFEPKTAFEAVRQPCGALLNQLPAQANPLARPVLSPSEIAMKLQYSQCMREHGVPEWQDPGADGYYSGPAIEGYNTDPAVTARVNAARDVCDPIIGR